MATNQVINITEFKAKCLSLFDEVEAGKISITVTKRGKVVGVVSPPSRRKPKSLAGSWAGRIKENVDLATVDTSDMWDVVNGRPWPK
ncbi:MAG TPA: type II toxin-antitoxin system prevent-host-death family antitoxin [Bryobacteraceae bacterium]